MIFQDYPDKNFDLSLRLKKIPAIQQLRDLVDDIKRKLAIGKIGAPLARVKSNSIDARATHRPNLRLGYTVSKGSFSISVTKHSHEP